MKTFVIVTGYGPDETSEPPALPLALEPSPCSTCCTLFGASYVTSAPSTISVKLCACAVAFAADRNVEAAEAVPLLLLQEQQMAATATRTISRLIAA
jgi:hypothetical protein